VGNVYDSGHRRGGALRATPEEIQAAQIEDAVKAANDAMQVPEGTGAEDLKAFYDILQSQTWEEAQQAVVDLQASGGLHEGVVETAVMALNKTRDNPVPPGQNKDQLISTLESVCDLLIRALQVQEASPALRLVDELVLCKPTENRELVKQRLEMEFKTDGGLSRDELVRSMNGFLGQMDDQDKDFAAQVEAMWEGASEDERAQVANMTEMRGDARGQMTCLLEIASALP